MTENKSLFEGELPEHWRDTNPVVRLLGKGPEGKRCKDCGHLFARKYNKTYYKCALRRCTNGPATDHRVRWNACSKFVEAEK